jgi:HAD superfamily hydrolase (TIGR01509 family)
MIKGIFFDAAGILYRRSTPTAEFALALLAQAGYSIQVSAPDLARLEAMRQQASQGQVSHAAYWEQFLGLRGVTDPEQSKAMIGQIIEYSNNVLPVSGSRETLAALKKRGFILGIVTDTMYPVEWKMRRLTQAGVAEFIDVVACSTVLGVHKPDPAMYLNALQQAQLSPAESAFVGHDAAEIRGARQAGMVTVALHDEPGVQADFTCQTLLDLLGLPIFQTGGSDQPVPKMGVSREE